MLWKQTAFANMTNSPVNVIKVSMVMDIHVRGRTCSASCDGGIRHRYVFDSGDSNSNDTNENQENIQTEVCNEK